MNLNTVFPLPAWLTTDEKKRYNKMKRPFLAHARDLGIKMDPFLLAQINDFLIGQLLLARAELPLQDPNALPSEKLFKLREKLSKNMQELQATFEKAAESKQTFSSPSYPENHVNPVENSPSLPCPENSPEPNLPDPSDFPQSPPSSLCIGVSAVNSPSSSPPVSPPINPNSMAAYMARHNAACERRRLQEFDDRAKIAALKCRAA